MNTFTIADAFNHGWRRTKEQFWLLASVLVTYGLISMALSRIGEMSKNHVVFNIVAFLFTLIVGVVIRIGLTRFFLNADEGKGSYKDLFSTDGVFFTYFVGYILLSIITVLGFVLLIVPGVIIMLMYFFVPTLIIDRKLEVRESFKESAAMTKNHRLHLLGFLAVCVVVNFVGLIVFVVGLLLTVPMTYFATLYIYRRLLGAEMPVVVESVATPPQDTI